MTTTPISVKDAANVTRTMYNTDDPSTGALQTALNASAAAVALAISKTVKTATTTLTLPASAITYAAGDSINSSVGSPVPLSFTIADAAGKGGILIDLEVMSGNPAGTPLQGELWLFDTSPTAPADDAAFAITDANNAQVVAVIPFALTSGVNNGYGKTSNIGQAFTTVSGTVLYGLVKAANAYTRVSAEVLTFRLKAVPVG